ncbi:MAG: hypothetical protein D6690_13725 [Nitrospirae bacterium]|nr:MAG: hypothetical protein D6690_13725 [Nitrospirota bacterium]
MLYLLFFLIGKAADMRNRRYTAILLVANSLDSPIPLSDFSVSFKSTFTMSVTMRVTSHGVWKNRSACPEWAIA